MWRKGNPSALLVGMQTGAATVENSMELPQKIKNGTALRPSDPTSENVSEEPKILMQKNISTPMFIAVLFTIPKTCKQPKCPSVYKWIKKAAVHNGILLGYKKKRKKTLSFATAWMDLKNIVLSEISQSE